MWRQFSILNFDPHQKILNNLRFDYLAVIMEYIKSENIFPFFKKNYEETIYDFEDSAMLPRG
jgi:hypothetical protein